MLFFSVIWTLVILGGRADDTFVQKLYIDVEFCKDVPVVTAENEIGCSRICRKMKTCLGFCYAEENVCALILGVNNNKSGTAGVDFRYYWMRKQNNPLTKDPNRYNNFSKDNSKADHENKGFTNMTTEVTKHFTKEAGNASLKGKEMRYMSFCLMTLNT